MGADKELLYEKRGHVVILTLNRPESRNAMNASLMHALQKAWLRFKHDDDAWVAILWGGEGPTFCAGMDLKEFAETHQQRDESEGPWWPDRWSPVDLEIWKPTIAAVNGHATAGGCWLTTTCHLCVAADTAQFGITEPRWNIGGGDQIDIIRLVGLRHAIELTVYPRLVPAQRAYEMGLVNWVVPKGQELAKALEVADAILECGPAAVRAFIESYYRCYGMEHFNAVKLAGHIQQGLGSMEDAKEGPRAFAEKRRPDFKNR